MKALISQTAQIFSGCSQGFLIWLSSLRRTSGIKFASVLGICISEKRAAPSTDCTHLIRSTQRLKTRKTTRLSRCLCFPLQPSVCHPLLSPLSLSLLLLTPLCLQRSCTAWIQMSWFCRCWLKLQRSVHSLRIAQWNGTRLQTNRVHKEQLRVNYNPDVRGEGNSST